MIHVLLAVALSTFTVNDTAYGVQRRVWLYQPPNATHLVVFVRGATYVDPIDAPAMLDSLIAEHKIPPTSAVFIDDNDLMPADIGNRAKFDQFIAKDLMPWVKTKLGKLPDPSHTTISGWSVGGLVASYVAFKHPDLFGNAISQSGALWRGNEGASEPGEWLTQQVRDHARVPVRFYVEVGGGETRAAPNGIIFIEANRHFRDALKAKGYDVEYLEVPNAMHEPGHWKSALPAALIFSTTSSPISSTRPRPARASDASPPRPHS